MLESVEYPWYALSVKARHEKKVSLELRGKGLNEFLPLYRSYHRSGGRLQPVLLPLFPGYLFCSFDIQHRLPVLTCPGVLSIVGYSNHPISLTAEELQAIETMTESGLELAPWPYLEVGERVFIQEGPLRGMEGILIGHKGNFRLIISIGLLQRSVSVEIDRCWVRPAPSPRGIEYGPVSLAANRVVA